MATKTSSLSVNNADQTKPLIVDSQAPNTPTPSHTDSTANADYYDDDTSVEFSWNSVSDNGQAGIKHYRVYYSTDGGSTYSSTTTTSTSYTVSASNGDTVKVKVSAVDNADNVGPNGTSSTIEVDTDEPAVSSVTVTPNPVTDSDTGSTVSVSITFDEEMDTSTTPTVQITGLTKDPYSVSNGDWKEGSSGEDIWTGTFTINDDKEDTTATVDISGADDLAGNEMSADSSKTFTVDTESPTPSSVQYTVTDFDSNGVLDVEDAITVTADLSDYSDLASTSPVTVDLSAIGGPSNQQMYDDGSNGDSSDGDQTYTYNYTVTAAGVDDISANTYNPSVTAEDDVANTASNSGTAISERVDVNKPTVDSVSYSAGTDLNDETLTVGFSEDIAVVGASSDYSVVYDPDGDFSTGDQRSISINSVSDGSNNNVELTIPDQSQKTDAGGSFKVEVLTPGNVQDAAGNGVESGDTTATSSTVSQFDSTAPTVESYSVTKDSSWDTVTVEVDADEPLDTSTISAEITDSNGDTVTTLSGFTETDSTNYVYQATYDVNSGVEDSYTATLQSAEDTSGNSVSSPTNSGTVSVDTQSPSVSGVTITDTSISSTQYVKDGDDVEITADISDANLANGDTAKITADLSNLGEGSSVNPGSYDGTAATWTLNGVTTSTSDGTVSVSVTANDPAGNTGTGSDDITADNTPPSIDTAASVSISTDSNGNNILNKGDEFKVSVTVSDSSSGIDTVNADLSALGKGSKSLTHDSGGTYTGTFTVPSGYDVGSLTPTVTVTDNAGNSETSTPSSGPEVDSNYPQDPSSTTINTDPINLGNDDAVSTEVSFSSQPESGTVYVQVYDSSDNVLGTGSATADTTSKTTSVSVDVSGNSIEDSGVYAKAKIVDSADNTNSAGYTSQSSTVRMDTVRPSVTDVRTWDSDADGNIDEIDVTYSEEVTNVGSDDITVTYNSTSYTVSGATKQSDGKTVEYTLQSEINGTSAKPTVSFQETNIQDLNSNNLETTSDQTSDDGAEPITQSLSYTPGADGATETLKVGFSEDITSVGSTSDYTVTYDPDGDFSSTTTDQRTIAVNAVNDGSNNLVLLEIPDQSTETDYGGKFRVEVANSNVKDQSGNTVSSVGDKATSSTVGKFDTTSPNKVKGASAAAQSGGDIKVSWDSLSATDIQNYVVYKKESGGSYGSGTTVTGTSKTFSGLTDGTTYTFKVEAVDYSGNTGLASDEVSATADSSGPTFSNEQPADSAYISTAQPSITVDISDTDHSVDSSTLSVTVKDANTDDGAEISGGTSTNGISYSGETLTLDTSEAGVTLAEGVASVTVDGDDSLGNANSLSWEFTVDTQAPVSTIDTVAGDDVINSDEAGAVTVSGSVKDANPDKVDIEIGSSISRTGVEASGRSYSASGFDLNSLSEGTTTVKVTATDLAGNTQSQATTRGITIDTVAPSIKSATTTSTTTVEVELEDATTKVDVSTISKSDFKVAGATPDSISGFSSNGATVTGTLTLSSANSFGSGATPTVSVVSDISDTAGNTVSSDSITATDGIKPKITSTSITDNNGQITVTFSEDVDANDALLTASEFSLSSSSLTALGINKVTDFTGTNNTAVINVTFDRPADGTESITVEPADGSSIYDVADNTMDTGQSNNQVNLNDREMPEVSVAPADGSTVTTVVGSNSVTVNATVTDEDTLSSLSIEVTTKTGTKSCTLSEATQNGDTYSCEFSIPNEIDHNVTVTATDAAGNTNSVTNTFALRKEFVLALDEGSNMVSIPITLSDNSPETVFGGHSEINEVWSYNEETDEWNVWYQDNPDQSDLSSFKHGEGYWVETESATTITLTGKRAWATQDATQPLSYTLFGRESASDGWNFIGFTDPENGVNYGDYLSTGARTPLTYQSSTSEYVTDSKLDWGTGYWVYFDQQYNGDYGPYLNN